MAKNQQPKLKRSELLEVIVEQGREIEELKEKLNDTSEKLNSRHLLIDFKNAQSIEEIRQFFDIFFVVEMKEDPQKKTGIGSG